MNVAGTPVYLGLLLSLSFSVAKAAPSSFTYQGRIVRSDGQALEYNNVSFQFEVTNPSGSCVIYREQVDGIDMTNSKGMFDVAIGGGTRSYPTSGTVELLDVFKNQTSYPCSGGATYNALAADGRLLRVKFHDGTGWKTLSTDNVIRSVPFAGYSASAQKLEDKTLDQFVMKDILPSCLSGSYLTWDATAQAFGCSSLASASVSSFSGALAGDVSGTQGATSVNRLKGAVIDTTGIAANKILKFDGTKWVMGDDNTGGAPADASYSVKGIVQFTTDAATSGINIAAGVASVNVGTAANQIVKLDNLAKLPAVDGSALGNINAVKIQGKDVTLTAPSVNQVLQYDGSKFVNATLSFTDNDTLAALPCANGYVSYKAAGAWTCLAVSSTNVANTLMSRDSGGNFSATSADVNSLVLRDGVTAGTVSLSVPAGFVAYSLVWPSNGGTSGQVLGKGVGNNLQWMSAQTNTLTTGKIWVGSSNVANEVSMSGQATMDSSGVVTLANAAGDVSGAYSALSVDKIKGKAVDTTGIAVNKILKYDGTKWVMGDDNTGGAPADASYSTKGIVQFTTDAATSGINIAAGVASVNAGTNPNQLVKLDGSSKLPAVDGSQLTNISVSNFSGALAGDVTGTQAATSVVKIQNRAVSNTAPNSGDVLKWDGSAWSPGADAAGWTAVDATTTTKGIMRVGSQLAVSGGLVSVDSTTTGVASKVLSLDGSSVATASGMALKGAFGTSTIQASNSVFTNYSLTLPTSTGSNGQVLTSTGVSGVLNWTTPSTGWTAVDATTSSKGIVQIGSGINVASGTISVPAATTSTQGIMQVGAGLAVTTGTVKADSTTTAQANKLLMLDGSGVALAKGFSTSGTTSGSVTLQSATGTYSLTLPTALPGTSGQVLSSTTGGVMSWVTAMTNALTTDRIWIGNAGVATPTVVTGDVALSGGSFTVDGIQGRSVASTAPSTNDVLKWNGSTWTPGAATASSTPTIAAKSADFTVGTSEENYLYLVSGTTTATLPSVGSVAAGFRITLKRIGGGNVNVVANGTETIDGATTRALSTVYQMISVVNTGTQWVITSGGAVGTPASACVPGSQIFSAGTTYSYSVPADRATNCVFTVTIKGGAGGASNNGYAGGAGGGLQFTFTAPSSGSFEVLVGSNGGTPVAGYGGGGSGSLGTLYIGGGGGGASAIRYIDSGAVDTLLAVVGGGGGGGDSGSPGGAGGSMASGSNGSTAGLNEYGRGASGSAGGAGGTSNAGNGGAGGTSGIGTAGTGANFGAAGTAASIFSISSGGGGGGTATSGHQGGGGGGGYMGGGGGAAGTVYTGGGGGGSSYVNSSKMNSFTSIAGPSTGSPGSVIIEWN